MKVTAEERKMYQPITIVLETREELKRLLQLTGDCMYEYLKKEYGDEVHAIVDFKKELQVKLDAVCND